MLLRKGVYPYEFMDIWKKFNETTLPEKYHFYSSLNMEQTTDSDYNHSKRACKDCEMKNLAKYPDLYFKSNILLIANVFETLKLENSF